MELSHLNVIVVIVINLLEDFVESEATLVDDLKQVIENLILSVMHIASLLLIDSSLNEIFTHELIEFIILDYSILVFIDFLEESSNFILLKAHVEVAWEVSLEALKGEVAKAAFVTFIFLSRCNYIELVQLLEGFSSSHLRLDLPLDSSEYLNILQLVVEITDDSLSSHSNVMRRKFKLRNRGQLNVVIVFIIMVLSSIFACLFLLSSEFFFFSFIERLIISVSTPETG